MTTKERLEDLNLRVTELFHRQQFERALPVAEQSRAFAERHWGRQHPSVATSLNNRAALYHATGRHAEAEPCYERALEIRRNTLGDSYPFVEQSLNNLAVLCSSSASGRCHFFQLQNQPNAVGVFELSAQTWPIRSGVSNRCELAVQQNERRLNSHRLRVMSAERCSSRESSATLTRLGSK